MIVVVNQRWSQIYEILIEEVALFNFYMLRDFNEVLWDMSHRINDQFEGELHDFFIYYF